MIDNVTKIKTISISFNDNFLSIFSSTLFILDGAPPQNSQNIFR